MDQTSKKLAAVTIAFGSVAAWMAVGRIDRVGEKQVCGPELCLSNRADYAPIMPFGGSGFLLLRRNKLATLPFARIMRRSSVPNRWVVELLLGEEIMVETEKRRNRRQTRRKAQQGWTPCEHLQRRMASIPGVFSSAN